MQTNYGSLLEISRSVHQAIHSEAFTFRIDFQHDISGQSILAMQIKLAQKRAGFNLSGEARIHSFSTSISSKGSHPDQPVVTDPTRAQERRDSVPGPKNEGISRKKTKRGPWSLTRPFVLDEALLLNEIVTSSPLLKWKFFI